METESEERGEPVEAAAALWNIENVWNVPILSSSIIIGDAHWDSFEDSGGKFKHFTHHYQLACVVMDTWFRACVTILPAQNEC